MIEKYLKSPKKIEYFEEITSTNTVLKERAEKEDLKNTLLISDFQTAGKGRLGKTFFSPKGCGIYFSYLINPEIQAQDAVFITVAAAVAIRRALRSVFDIETKIKWVNDIYFDNKKLCGILTEGKLTPKGLLSYAVLGVGINFNSPPSGYPLEFAHKTTNLSLITGKNCDSKKWQVVAEIINNFDEIFADNKRTYITEYKEASCLLGKEVEILSGQYQGFGKALDIDDNARLIVALSDKTVALESGDVSIRFI